MLDDTIPLTLLSRALIQGGYGTEPVSYGRLYKATLGALFPAEQVAGRWMVRRADLPAVARAVALTGTGQPGQRS